MTYLSDERIEQIVQHYGAEILDHDNMQVMQDAFQHGRISTYDHSVRVACLAVKLADRLHLWRRVDLKSLVRAALLHDYFLYDWHHHDGGTHRWHGFRHGRTAATNAHRDFNLNHVEHNSIHRHMFPLTPIPPKHIEGWLVTFADKISATVETLFHR
ncbi:phosphohydrolase [Bifidobacterium dolichotidis]|uniref:Phosphohydrolase n=1 Tax=Bifidobacterium dolichotidis TaxID=2306976 RepID=A0A430FTB9_9BIFI|nr:HD domain-containing protein [Bifidobacterium dolichotidis]RSX56133.1 phosphohydrolase [Bifidobacterium dolichotidis]